MCKLFQKFGSRFWDTTDFLAWKKISACNTWINRLICKSLFPRLVPRKVVSAKFCKKTELWQKKTELLQNNLNFGKKTTFCKKNPDFWQKN